MARPKFPKSLNEHNTSKTVHRIGQDMRGIVPYKFNNCGFRADVDYDENEKNAGCYFGNAFTSAVGIEWQDSYASKASHKLGAKAYNFSQGCVGVDNKEIIRTAIEVANNKTFIPKFFIIQFTDLIKRYNTKNGAVTFESDTVKNVEEFTKNFDLLEKTLDEANIKWFFFGCDFEIYHPVPDRIIKHKNCLIWNPAFFDKILYGMPGERWHHLISYGIFNKFENE